MSPRSNLHVLCGSRLTFARNIQESIFQPSAQTYIVTLYRDPQPDLRSAQPIRHEYKYTEPANEYPPNSSTARISYSQPSHIYEPALERRSMVVRPSFSYEAPPVEAQTERFISGQLLSVQYVQGDSSHYTTFMPPAGTTREYTSAEWQERSYERGSAAAVFGEQSLSGAWTHVANGQNHPHEGHAHLQTDAGPHEPHSGVYVVRENEGNGRLVEHEQRVHRAAEPPPHETRTTSADHPGPLDRASQAAMLEALLDAAPEDPSVKPLPEPPGTPKAATAAQAKAARPNAAMAVQPKEAKRDSEAAIARNPGLPARSHSPPAAAPPRPPAAEPQGGRRGSLRELKSAGGPQGARRGMLQGLASGSFHGLPSSTEDTRRRGLPNTGSFRGLPGSPEPAVASPKIAAAAPGRAMAGRIAPPQQWLASDDEEDVGFDRAPLGHGNGDAGPVRGTGRGGPKPAPRPVAVSDDDGAM